MSATETQYTVKVPLNPTGFPTNDKVVIWDTSEGRFQLRDDGNCQLVYQWNTTSPITQPPSQGQLSLTTSAFSANTGNFNYIGLSLTSYTGNDLTNYLSGYTSASFVITQLNDPSYFMAFNANLLAVSNGVIVFNIVTNTFSSSSPPESGTPENGSLLCVNISPLGVSSNSNVGTCENIVDIDINFTGLTIGQNFNFIIESGLTVNNGTQVQISYQPNPNIYAVGEVVGYTASTGNISTTITYLSNDGYSSGTVDENDVCYYLTIENDLFIFQRTLFVDPNGDDTIASSVFPYGGTLHPPFKTIQGAIQYIDDNYTYGDVTVHVFAGSYNVTTETPIRVGIDGNNTNIHLYLEDGVRINGSTVNVSTNPNDPDYYFIIQGNNPSITGHGVISFNGEASSTTYVDGFRIISPVQNTIKVKRIDSSIRDSVGRVFYYPASGDTISYVYFDGEVLINNGVNNSLLHIDGTNGGKTRTFEFSHNCKINIKGNDVGGNNIEPVSLGYVCYVIVRGSWYINPATVNDPRTTFYFNQVSGRLILDGCELYQTEPDSYDDYNIIYNSASSTDSAFIEIRERCITTGYIDNTQNIINLSYGILEQNIPLTPTILYSY